MGSEKKSLQQLHAMNTMAVAVECKRYAALKRIESKPTVFDNDDEKRKLRKATRRYQKSVKRIVKIIDRIERLQWERWGNASEKIESFYFN